MKTPTRPDPVRRIALHGGLLFAALMSPALAGPQGRMDPHDRERLRHELREQSRDERMRAREDRMRVHPQPGQFAPGPMQRDAPPGNPWPGAGDHPHPRGPGMPPGGPDSRHRMSPQEREELRMMLRERQRGRD